MLNAQETKKTFISSGRIVIAGSVLAIAVMMSTLAFTPADAQTRNRGESVERIPAGYTLQYRFGARGFVVQRNSDSRTFYFRRGRLTFIDPRYSISQQIEQIERPFRRN
ncbi:MAG: hypothetical protein AAGA88_00075 [Pseudomonadota bacterium]